ncbi:glyceraldehyde-3-phosphate dehydrogenase B [Populus alba x Populus x berolinensis]|nr:glyceraldehyde-3-phosphate dehydrogenase B [Populus alba x Populus x berolinensis]
MGKLEIFLGQIYGTGDQSWKWKAMVVDLCLRFATNNAYFSSISGDLMHHMWLENALKESRNQAESRSLQNRERASALVGDDTRLVEPVSVRKEPFVVGKYDRGNEDAHSQEPLVRDNIAEHDANGGGFCHKTKRVFEVNSCNASCTTNCLAPFVKVIDEEFGIVKGTMTTTHSYTGDQRLLDASHRDLRRARAAALNIVPTSTGAAKAVSLVLPQLRGKLNGIALRVPTPNVSVVDPVVNNVEKKGITAEDVNAAFRKAAEGPLKGVLDVCDVPLVSVDFRCSDVSSTIDSSLTMVMGDDMIKVVAWYDNEWGYSQRVVDLAHLVASKWPGVAVAGSGDPLEDFCKTNPADKECKWKPSLSADEYIRMTPHISEDREITLGLKKTTAFLVNAKMGRVICTYKFQAFEENAVMLSKDAGELVESGDVDLRTFKHLVYIRRTDYVLQHYAPNSTEILWNVAFADTEAEFRCQGIQSSYGGVSLNANVDTDVIEWQLPCQMKTVSL